MGISPGGLERQRPFRPIFGREINHTRLEAGDPQSAICNLQFAIPNSQFPIRNSLRCWLILKQEAMKSGNLLRGFMASCFIYFQTEPTTFPPARTRLAQLLLPRQSEISSNFLKILFAWGGRGWLNATLIIRFSPPVSHHASPPIRLPLLSRNATPTLHPSLQDPCVFHRTFSRLLSF